MESKKDELDTISKYLIEIRDLLRHSVAIQLSARGATQDEIAQSLKASKTTVNKMLKGIKSNKVIQSNE